MVIQVDLKGSSREIGIQHGKLLRVEILRQIAFYGAMFQSKCQLNWPQVLEVAVEFKVTLAKLVPDLLEEMEGIAEGVNENNVGVMDIIALNCRSEIALGKWTDGCTAMGLNTGGEDQKQFLAQNWDWDWKMKDNIALMSIEKSGKPKIWMVTEAGIIGKIGFNSSSVGVCLNAIRARPMLSSLLPIHVLLRLVLESNSTSGAIRRLEELQGCGTSAHMLIADSSGSRGVEISPLGICIIDQDEDGVVVHSNHFIRNHLVDEPPWLEDSPFRIKRIRELCGKVVEQRKNMSGSVINIERIRMLFRDKANSPAAICRQVDRNIPGGIESLFNIVMELAEGNPKAEVVFGIGREDEGDVIQLPW